MYKKLKTYAKYLSLFSAVSTLLICLIIFSDAYTAAAIATIVWFVSPYAYLAFLINLVATQQTTIAAVIISLTCCLYGLLSLLGAAFIHPAIETGTININAPLWQWAALLTLTLPLVIFNKFKES